MHREKTFDLARGRWAGILSAIGVPHSALRNKQGPCPMCGGRTKFRFDDKGGDGTWICNTSSCGAGNGLTLVMKFKGLDFKEAADLVDEHLGEAPAITLPAQRQPSGEEHKRKEMIALWERSKPVTVEDQAGRYLVKRRCWLELSPDTLRFAPDERYFDPGSRPSWHPALVAKVDPSDAAKAEGQRSALHRTYLDGFGGKADVASPRKMLGTMPDGAAVRLMPHEDVLGIAEGIETALSASIIYGVPVWAALTADLLRTWAPPPGLKVVMIFGDHDVSFTGQAAAYTLAQHLKAKGLTAIVELPPKVGTDWNDVLRERKAA